MAYESTSSVLQGGALAVGQRAEILPSVPIPELNSIGGPAFAARMKGVEGSSDLLGILCNTSLPPRLDTVNSMRGVDHVSLLRLIDSGVVAWPDNNRYYAFAFQRPLAPRFKTSIDETHTPMREDTVNHYFVTPLIGALQEMQRAGIVHNGIRPTNIFWRPGTAMAPQLNECLSVPGGYGQPVLFETIERGLCPPIGRGVGQHSDDCYALGVTLAMTFLGLNPLQGMDDASILRLKIERGSFAALVGNHRLSASHIEILRGLLSDDARQRWSGNDLDQWLNGRRLTPKNTDTGHRASRHYDFCGKEYWSTRSLAAALPTNVTEAVQIIENGSLEKWLRRAMDDDERANNLVEMLTVISAAGKTANYEEQLVARTCIILDPSGPLRYRGICVMPGGISSMLVETVMSGGSPQILAEIIANQLVAFWVETQQDIKTELVPLGQQFERMKLLIEKTTYGNGIERVIYELNPGLPCLSPIVASQYVVSPRMLLAAFERLAASGNRPPELVDRHLAAFLIVRDQRSELLFEAIAAPESDPRRGIGILTLLSEMQYRYGPDSTPALAQWIAPMLEPAIQRFLGKALKEKLRQLMREAVQRGDLSAMLQLADDPRRIERDKQDFTAARMLYLNIQKEIALCESKIQNKELVVRSIGKPMAASISTFLAIIMVFAAILRAVWQAIMGSM
ncbi:MAG: serine/threonine protein kinase [Alphaproteobacteria bacterium]|nr:serine/threonine protein kinase [Alphaproteobacteria bacterium]